MSALAQCDAFAYIYDQAGDPAPDVLVVLKRVLDASGNPILLGPKTTLTDSAGAFHFTLPEFGTAFISARASALWNCPDGRAFTVPPGPSGELVPDFSLPASTLVEPPLVYVGDVLSIPKASASQDGYLSAADFVAFEAGAGEMGVTSITAGTGLTGGTITDTGTIGLANIAGVAGTWANPSSITVNAQGQIIAISGVADTTPPVITLGSPTNLLATSVTINWTTNELADSQVDYSTDTSYGTSTPLNATPVTDHHVSITGIAALTTYNYRVQSKDPSGNPAIPVTSTFITPAGADTTAPVITLDATPVTAILDVSATINWTTNEVSDSLVEYSIDPDTSYGTSTGIGNPVPPGTTSHHAILTSLIASKLYHYRVKSKDAAGNQAIPVTGTFNTLATAPVVNTLLTSLSSMWQLEESGAAPRADSHGANTLTLFEPLGTGTGVPSGTGKISTAAHLLGTGNRFHVASSTSLQTGGADYTWAYWINLDSKSEGKISIAKAGESGGTGDEYILGYELESPPGTSIDRFRFTVQGGGTYTSLYSTSAVSPVIGTWYLVVMWHQQSDNTIHIQVNDGAENSVAVVPPLVASADSMWFGSYGTGSGSLLAGLIDEAAYWKGRALDAPNRTALWNGGAGLPFSSWT